MEMCIDFPAEEHEQLKRQLEEFGFAYTTRVPAEVGKYEVGFVLDTPWGRRVRISEIRAFDNVEQHPFLSEISDRQIEQISKFGRFEVLKIEYV